jgi:hypothetical protein
MQRFSRRFLAVVVAFVAAACETTVLEDSWRDPEAGPIQFHRVAVLALTGDPALRRSAEDQLVSQIPRGEAVAAYTFIVDQDLADTEKVKERMKEAGFDGAVVFRVIGSREKQSYVPGQYSVTPGYVVTDTYVEVETRVYSVAEDKLIWAARSETVSPLSVRDLVDRVARAAAKELRKQGLIP